MKVWPRPRRTPKCVCESANCSAKLGAGIEKTSKRRRKQTSAECKQLWQKGLTSNHAWHVSKMGGPPQNAARRRPPADTMRECACEHLAMAAGQYDI